MDFSLTGTQREIAHSARRLLASGGTWQELGKQGWLDEDLGSVELGLLAQEGGYALNPTPWWSTVALPPPLFEPRPSTLASGEFSAQGSAISGYASFVPDGANVQRLVLVAGDSVFGVPTQQPGVRVQEQASLDQHRGMARIELDSAQGTRLADASVMTLVRRRVQVLISCEAVGVGARAMDFAVDYAKVREQFGRPIGSFQAVAHQLADGYVELELARSLAYRAAWLAGASAQDGELDEALWCALATTRQAAVRSCEIAIQTLGGMGVTWEHPLHHWMRRALWLQAYDPFGADPFESLASVLLERSPQS
ncbi:acyl-CoA dehydrogenase family protein [Catelliglobosispora koreensis]|uniref:acyl-CoA dehydrogenase family protein n=1 Tax=Catelliglobosispora koreensis TaxID=129052 RepID=UPI00035C897F|nr:acyl-CoA dehydrogenase [Catelliglobosispora koreensis]